MKREEASHFWRVCFELPNGYLTFRRLGSLDEQFTVSDVFAWGLREVNESNGKYFRLHSIQNVEGVAINLTGTPKSIFYLPEATPNGE